MTEDPLAWETLDRRVAYACDGFDVVNERVRLPDGSTAEFDYLSEPESVVVLPFVDGDEGQQRDEREVRQPDEREVVVIEEWRHAVGRVNRGLPAGTRDPGDPDLATTAHRELAEETGYTAESVEPLAVAEPANGFADSEFHYFVARSCRPDGDRDLDHDESIRVDTTTLSDLRRAVAAGEIRDGRTALGVLYHQIQSQDRET